MPNKLCDDSLPRDRQKLVRPCPDHLLRPCYPASLGVNESASYHYGIDTHIKITPTE